jgi:hypothetical protein
MCKSRLWKWSISICRSSERGTWMGRLLYWGLIETCKGGLWKWSICLFIEEYEGRVPTVRTPRDMD